MQQISAHICDRGGGFVEANSFLAKKNLFHRFTYRLYVCLFLSDDRTSGFYLIHFDWLPDHFRKFSDAQLKTPT